MRVLINIDVPDLAAGIAFYTDGLGFQLQRRLFNGTVAEMTLSAQRIYLLACAPGTAPVAGRPATRDYADHWTPVHLDLVVEDVDAAHARAIAAGARVTGPPKDHAFGRFAALRDPFGHGFCLIAFNDHGYDSAT